MRLSVSRFVVLWSRVYGLVPGWLCQPTVPADCACLGGYEPRR